MQSSNGSNSDSSSSSSGNPWGRLMSSSGRLSADGWMDGSSYEEEEEAGLPFDPEAIEDIILKLIDKYNYKLRVHVRQREVGATVLTASLSIVRTVVVGKHGGAGGTVGAALGDGEASGSTSGARIVYVSLRDIWEELKGHLKELFVLTFEYIVLHGFSDYQSAASSLLSDSDPSCGRNLIKELANTVSLMPMLQNLEI